MKDYDGDDNDVDAAQEYIHQQFKRKFEATIQKMRASTVEKVQSAADQKKLYSHVTIAYDRKDVETKFTLVKGIIIASTETAHKML